MSGGLITGFIIMFLGAAVLDFVANYWRRGYGRENMVSVAGIMLIVIGLLLTIKYWSE